MTQHIPTQFRDVEVLQREFSGSAEEMRRRVAIYARVSTDKEEQCSSLETQMAAFQERIASRPDWELTAVYADEGISGTQAKKRTEFLRLLADCEAGKIDYIVTKSISRFARNTMECLQYVRKLKGMGVHVYFDKEKLDTAHSTSEMLLSILAAVAQEESRSLSENLKWSYRKRFQAGVPKWVNTYGYKKNEAGEYVVHEEQAASVRRIFALYTSGLSLPKVADALNREGIPACQGGIWRVKTVATILHNEKYVGDIMMQKSYTIDHLSHKKVANDQTVLPSYYVRDHHAPIVSRKIFETAQRMLALNDRHRGAAQYPYGGKLVCPICGAQLTKLRLATQSAWCCAAQNTQCPPYAICEKYIDQLVRDAYHTLDKDALGIRSRDPDPQIALAANEALEWKQRLAYMQEIPFLLLDALVEKIAFPQWSEGEIAWAFGMKSRVRVEYDKLSETPAAELEQHGGAYYFNGDSISQGRQVFQSLMNTRKSVIALRQAKSESG